MNPAKGYWQEKHYNTLGSEWNSLSSYLRTVQLIKAQPLGKLRGNLRTSDFGSRQCCVKKEGYNVTEHPPSQGPMSENSHAFVCSCVARSWIFTHRTLASSWDRRPGNAEHNALWEWWVGQEIEIAPHPGCKASREWQKHKQYIGIPSSVINISIESW